MPASDYGSDMDKTFASFHHDARLKPIFQEGSPRSLQSYVFSSQEASSSEDLDNLSTAPDDESLETSAPPTSSWISASASLDPPLPLVLSHRSASCTIPIPSKLSFLATCLKDRFLSSLEESDTEEPSSQSSAAVLVARWLEFVFSNGTEGPCGRVLRIIFDFFESEFLRSNDIHVLASAAEITRKSKMQMLRSYFVAKASVYPQSKETPSALLRAATVGDARLYAIFGGQGNTTEYFEELRNLYNTYPAFTRVLIETVVKHLLSLSESQEAYGFLPEGLDVMKWLQSPLDCPDNTYLISATVSFPIIGLLQLAQYASACGVFDATPGWLRRHFRGVTGHSQGIVVAGAIAASDSWDSFYQNAKIATTVLFWTGLRCQQTASQIPVDPSMVQDSLDNDEGVPSPMLSIRNLTEHQVMKHLDALNKHLEVGQKVEIGLCNGPQNFVISGPVRSLHGLNVRLRRFKAAADLDQTRIPFSQRKIAFHNRFLPTTAPFHSSHVADAVAKIDLDLRGLAMSRGDVVIPVYHTATGEDLRFLGDDNIIPALVRMIVEEKVFWECATTFPAATHILDFGPGSSGGVGLLTAGNKEGTGARVILASALDGALKGVGYQPELFSCHDESVVYNDNWAAKYKPTLVRTSAGKTYISTKFSRLLSLPPVMVAGMTPTTAHWDFVAATASAGFHVELAGGGYYTEHSLCAAVHKVAKVAPPGRAIILNVLYVNPRSLAWQLASIQKLRAEGINVDGLTIGAGVPSLSVACEYIETLGLRHISFKPGSVQGITDVIEIAKAHPSFPVVLQWTGGRGGGHHSCEDFHEPILRTYGRMRQCENLILVAGSGFGVWKDTYPYFTGEWSVKLGYPAMPFDGVLFGSRIMTAKEAHTGLGAKEAIAAAPGVGPECWEDTYRSPDGGGGVITVISEMGQPIHKLATRGVRLWAELDRTIFSLPKEQRGAELRKRRKYIIQRLNADFQKVWFGTKDGQPVDLDQMTYGEVAHRLAELLYVKSQSRWIDVSYQKLFHDFLSCIEEKFGNCLSGSLKPRDSSTPINDPFEEISKIQLKQPDAKDKLMTVRDMEHFLTLCRRPRQKPVPFIPVLDDDFETYFKKDSLWQFEDLEAVVDHDAGRTCILQGPVAVGSSNTINEPISAILNEINDGLIGAVKSSLYHNDEPSIPQMDYFSGHAGTSIVTLDNVAVTPHMTGTTYSLPSDTTVSLPSVSQWISLLSGGESSWSQALFMSDIFVQNYSRCQPNIVRKLLAPRPGLIVDIEHSTDPEKTKIRAQDAKHRVILQIELSEGFRQEISVDIFNHYTATVHPVPLRLKYTYHPEAGYAPIREVMDDRSRRINEFYKRTWLGDDPLDFDVNMNVEALLKTTFCGDRMIVSQKSIQDFCRTVGNTETASVKKATTLLNVPMDMALILGWKALVKPLFTQPLDLLRLVHLSNSFRMLGPGLQEGDEVGSISRVTAILNQDSGKMIEVTCTVTKNGMAAVEIVSRFLIRGQYTDFENTFQVTSEGPIRVKISNAKDFGVLRSRKWLSLIDGHQSSLIGKSLLFHLETTSRPRGDGISSSLETTGVIRLDDPTAWSRPVGTLSFKAARAQGNPINSYLERQGTPVEQRIDLEQPIVSTTKALSLTMPKTNETYARVSGDFNPIHVLDTFASFAGLPGTVTHGMHTSAAVRSVVQNWTRDSGRMCSYDTSFVGMVLPGDELEVKVWHTAMISGRKVLKIEAAKKDTTEMVLVGEAHIEQSPSAYIFTGQGSQEVGMGMDLYATSPAARGVWDRADKYFTENFGFAITTIVKLNPTHLTIHFGGRRGHAIRRNYLSLSFVSRSFPGGTPRSQKVFEDITPITPSYTFRNPAGLLHATQFTQPALTLMAKAHFEDMKARGLIPRNGALFAGHSLGEYSAISTLGELMSVEELMAIVFFRGLTMRLVIKYDDLGRSEYGMAAVNPSKVGGGFDEESLRWVVAQITVRSGWLLEIVNYNIEGLQYVCAGTLRALWCLSNVLECIRSEGIGVMVKRDCVDHVLVRFVEEASTLDSHAVELVKTATSTPLRGVDVPFHSSFLRSGVDAYREFLKANLARRNVKPELLVDKWIPNVTGKPFGISKIDFEEAYRLTGSQVLRDIVLKWDEEDEKLNLDDVP